MNQFDGLFYSFHIILKFDKSFFYNQATVKRNKIVKEKLFLMRKIIDTQLSTSIHDDVEYCVAYLKRVLKLQGMGLSMHDLRVSK